MGGRVGVGRSIACPSDRACYAGESALPGLEPLLTLYSNFAHETTLVPLEFRSFCRLTELESPQRLPIGLFSALVASFVLCGRVLFV